MKNNSTNIHAFHSNLLNDAEFKAAVKFEAEYAVAVKGGHLPYYYGEEKRSRIVNSINFLTSKEKQELIHHLFPGKN